MTRPFYSILFAACIVGTPPALADFAGFPLADGANYTWYEAREVYNPIGQIYSGIVERCEVTTITAPNIVQTWTVSAGSSNQVVGAYTNVILLTDTITTTNQLGPFTYSYTDPSGTYTATGYPYVTRAFLNALDTTIDSLIPKFASTNSQVFTSGTYDTDWFGVKYGWYWDNDGSLFYEHALNDFPAESKAGLFYREGVGYATNLTTNAYFYSSEAWVDGGIAWYTRQPATTIDWLLSESHYTSNGFTFVDIGALDTRLYQDIKPVVRYLQGGTNALSAVSLTIQGSALVLSNQSTVATSEVVSVSATNTACTVQWYDITNITSASTSANTGDTYSVIYTNEVVLYGDRPYRLYAADLDERAAVLGALTHAIGEGPIVQNWTYNATNYHKRGDSISENTAAEARTEAENDYDYGSGSLNLIANAFVVREGANDWDATIEKTINKVTVTNLSTSLPNTLHIYAENMPQGLSYQSWTNTLEGWQYDDDGEGWPSNQIARIDTISNTNALNGISGAELGNLSLPAWPSTDPPDTNDAINLRGFQSNLEGIIIEWDFDYK